MWVCDSKVYYVEYFRLIHWHQVLKQYFSTIEAESIRDNFIIILELLDEMMDNGCPQTTEPNILKE